MIVNMLRLLPTVKNFNSATLTVKKHPRTVFSVAKIVKILRVEPRGESRYNC